MIYIQFRPTFRYQIMIILIIFLFKQNFEVKIYIQNLELYMQAQKYPQLADIREINLQKQARVKKTKTQTLQQKLKRFQFGWKFVVFLTVNFYIFSGPLAFGFPQYYDYNRSTLLPLNFILILILLFDIVFDFFSIPKMVKGKSQFLIFNSFRKNAKKYAKYVKYYLIDHMQIWDIGILVLLCFHFMPNFQVGRYFGLIILLKLSNMVTYNNQIYKRLHAKPVARSVYTLAKIIYLSALLTHYLGIIFYVIDQTLIENQYFGTIAQNPALYYQGMSLCFSPIASSTLFQKYIWAAYYSSSLISTIAYGDIIPKNYFQNIYVCFLMIISTLFIALLLQQFMILVRQQKFGQYQFIKNFNCLKEFMNQKLVPVQIQNSVRSYLVYLQFEKKLKNQKPVMSSLTKKLQRQILSYGYLDIYQSKFRFFGINSQEMLQQVGLLLQEVLCQAQCVMLNPFLNNKQIQDQENIQNHQIQFHSPSLFFVYEGKVQQFTRYDQNSKQFNFLLDQPSKIANKKAFNMYQFITGSQLRYGIRTIQLTKLIKFNPKQFLSFIMRNDQVYNKFKSTKEKVLCQEISAQNIDGNCFICDKNDHSFADCPQCHYSLKQNIEGTVKISNLLKIQKYENKRTLKDRQNINSKKVKDIAHRSAIWGKLQIKNLNFAYSLLFNNTTKQLLNIQVGSNIVFEDSKYDNFGIDLQFQI